MYEYKFVQVAVTYQRGTVETGGYESAIAEHASQGWRFVQLLVTMPTVMPTEYQLIFERLLPGEAG